MYIQSSIGYAIRNLSFVRQSVQKHVENHIQSSVYYTVFRVVNQDVSRWEMFGFRVDRYSGFWFNSANIHPDFL